MTSRKPAATAEVTQPAIPADVAFGNIITAQRDTAVVEEQALQSQKSALIGQFERDLARLHAGFDTAIASLDDQLGRQANIITASDAALASLISKLNEKSDETNVVALAAE